MNKYLKLLVVVVGAVIILVGAVQLTLAAILSSNPINISKTRTDSGYPAIAVSPDGQHIGMVWSDRYPNPTGANPVQGPIYFKSAKDGATLDQRVTVDGAFSDVDQSWLPDIVTDPISPANMHVVWTNKSGGGLSGNDELYTIYYARCATSNATCGSSSNHQVVEQVTNTVDNQQVVRNAKIVASTDGAATYLHVVYEFLDDSANPKQRRIVYQGKKGNGNWTNPVVVSSEGTGDFASHPAIAVTKDGSNNIFVHVVWASDSNASTPDDITDRIRYRRGQVNTVDGSVTWGSGIQSLPNLAGPTNTRQDYPTVAGVGSTVMILWDALKGGPNWPSGVNNPETYFAIYTYADNVNVLPINTALSFSTPAHLFTSPTDHISDNDPNGSSEPWLQGSEHGRRLQPKVTGEAALGGAKFYTVWHETTISGTTRFHDVRLAQFWHGTSSDPPENSQDEWFPSDAIANNETKGNKLGDPTPVDLPYYSMSPDVAVANDQVYALYMEGKEDGAYDVADTLFDIIYKGTVTLIDITTNNPTDLGGVFMPIILKNAS